jgi:hypothetical protein
MKPDEICLTKEILIKRLWGKTLVNGRLRSKSWWENKLHLLINKTEKAIPIENLRDGHQAEPTPIPFEVEFNMPGLNYETFLAAWKQMNFNR